MKNTLIERLVRYTKIDTRSDGSTGLVPSTKKQFELAKMLYEECIDIGLDKVKIDEYGIVTALLPSNTDKDVRTIGFIAHMDTADYNSENVSPRVIENYDGKDIVLNAEHNIITDVKTFPNLKDLEGGTLVVTDGLTLLGADDKAGIAEIMTAMEFLLDNKDIEHGDIRIAFTIDEEIGTGADAFDVEGFDADFAYTVDGTELGGLEYETFNAAETVVTLKGISVHPGSAKDTMINANVLVNEYFSQLPSDERAETTEGYEGFYLLTDTISTIEDAKLTFILRDHDMAKFNARKEMMNTIADKMNEKYAYQAVTVETKDSYYNMRNIIEEDMSIVELAKDAMKASDVEPIISAVRGGTDGSRLSYMGLPTPNLFTGAQFLHGRHELAHVESMMKACEVIINIAHLNTQGEL
ncbi:MAG: peptidase T [Erysipelothrix sp.]|nr:peptidase T [Erysipelothrix sp.]